MPIAVARYAIEGSTNADQVTGKVKSSLVSLEKQLGDIQRKFSSFGKDLFLSFAAPTVLLNSAISGITNMIEENRRKNEDALRFAEESNSRMIDAQTRMLARKQAADRKDREEVENAERAKRMTTITFLQEDARGRAIASEARDEIDKANASVGISGDLPAVVPLEMIAQLPSVIDAVAEALREETFVAQTIADIEAQRKPEEEKKATPSEKAGIFTAGEGMSSVIGVGQSPVLDVMNSQLEEAKKLNQNIQSFMENFMDLGSSADFTKRMGGRGAIP